MVFISKFLATMAAIPPISTLSNRVIRILGCNPGHMTLQGTNTYLIGTGKKRILLDAGEKDVIEYQTHLAHVLKTQEARIEHIIVTHWHMDHIGGVPNVMKIVENKAKVWKHKMGAEDDTEKDKVPNIHMNWLTDGQEIKVDGATLKIHHTPGHTTDHVVAMLLEDKVLFSGDCILGEGTAVFEDLYTYMQSLQKILDLKPEVIYPGHGNIVEDPLEKIQFYINHRNQREEQILNTLKDNADQKFTEMDLVKKIYTTTPEHLWPAAAYNVNHHLTKLAKENKIKMTKVEGENKWQIAGTMESHL